MKKKIYTLLFFLFLLLLVGSLFYIKATQKKYTVKKLFEDVFSETEIYDKENELYQKYGIYFTENGWEEALGNRIPLLGANLYQIYKETPESINIDIKDQGKKDWYICKVEVKYGNEESNNFLFTIQVMFDGKQWLIESISR